MLTGIVLTCSISATAQDADSPADLFKTLDANNDGKLVADEIPAEQVRFFERLVRLGDADSNGELTRSEFTKATTDSVAGGSPADNSRARRPGNPQFDGREFFSRLDRNGDGKLSRNELPEQIAERLGPAFEKLGKDALTLEEFQQLRQNMERGGANQPGNRVGQFGNPTEVFKRLDADGDGRLTIGEAPEQGRRMVAAILERSGKGRDGSLTLQEFEAAVERFNRDSPNGRPQDGQRKNREDASGSNDSDRRSMQRTDGNRPGYGGPAFLRILDANQDGKLTRDELANAVVLIERLDQNKDGALEPRELFGGPRAESMDRPRRESDRNSSNRPRRPESEQAANSSSEPESSTRPQTRQDRRPRNGNAEQIFKQVDRNSDGRISRDEAPDRMKQNFDRLDSNSDGSVSIEELRQAFDRFRNQK